MPDSPAETNLQRLTERLQDSQFVLRASPNFHRLEIHEASEKADDHRSHGWLWVEVTPGGGLAAELDGDVAVLSADRGVAEHSDELEVRIEVTD